MAVFFTPRARAQLRDIHDYIARDNVTAARAVVIRVEAVARFLGDNPEAGYRLPRGRLRRFPVRPFPYLIYYEIFGQTVLIIRIRHAAQYRRASHEEAVPFRTEKLWPLSA
jgi:plasmid stabilization system protein ParE